MDSSPQAPMSQVGNMVSTDARLPTRPFKSPADPQFIVNYRKFRFSSAWFDFYHGRVNIDVLLYVFLVIVYYRESTCLWQVLIWWVKKAENVLVFRKEKNLTQYKAQLAIQHIFLSINWKALIHLTSFSLLFIQARFWSGYICPLPRMLSTEPILVLTIQCWISWSRWGATYLFPLMPHQFCSIHCKEMEIQYFRTKLTTVCTSSIIPLNEDMKEIVLCSLTVFETIILE